MKTIFTFTILLVLLLTACGTYATPTTLISTPTKKPTQPAATKTKRIPTTTSVPITGCVTAKTLNIRDGPGIQYQIVGGLENGTCVVLKGKSQDNNWVWIVQGSLDGWASREYLETEGNLLNLPVRYSIAPTEKPSSSGQAGCPQGCTSHPPGCDIKGNISFNTGEKIYHLPGQEFYNETIIHTAYGERWFCTEAEAIANGWRKSFK